MSWANSFVQAKLPLIPTGPVGFIKFSPMDSIHRCSFPKLLLYWLSCVFFPRSFTEVGPATFKRSLDVGFLLPFSVGEREDRHSGENAKWGKKRGMASLIQSPVLILDEMVLAQKLRWGPRHRGAGMAPVHAQGPGGLGPHFLWPKNRVESVQPWPWGAPRNHPALHTASH